jgi:hypothetical protein
LAPICLIIATAFTKVPPVSIISSIITTSYQLISINKKFDKFFTLFWTFPTRCISLTLPGASLFLSMIARSDST